MSGSWLDALLGGIYSAGTKLALNAGLNFTSGLAASYNSTTKLIDVTASADDAQASGLAPFLAGPGLAVNAAGDLVPQLRPHLFSLEDRFTGSAISPGIGTHGWTQTGDGSFSCSKSVGGAGFTSRLRITSDATSGNYTAVHLGTTATATVLVPAPGVLRRAQFMLSSGLLTTRRVFVGFSTNMSSDAPDSALGFLFDSSVGGKIQFWARYLGSGDPVVSAVDLTTSSTLLTIDETATGFQFYANDTLLGELTSHLVTIATPLNLGVSVRTLANSAASVDCSYVGVTADLNGWNLDPSLEG